MAAIRSVFLGNWKMNLLPKDVDLFAQKFIGLFASNEDMSDVGFAPTFTSIMSAVQTMSKRGIMIGAQNAHWLDNGAHTGEISVPMLKDANIDFVILGHSERRQFYGETDENVSKRALAVLRQGLKAVVCVGETKEQFQAGETKNVVKTQLSSSLNEIPLDFLQNLIIAYEPVWAIGTGLAATPEIASQVHSEIRSFVVQKWGNAAANLPLLYGGSTTPDNVERLVSDNNINGALVGGASLKPEVFAELVKKGRKAKET